MPIPVVHSLALSVVVALTACTPPADPVGAHTTAPSLGWSDVAKQGPIELPQENQISGNTPVPESGQPVLLNYWASTCAPCRDEMPLLQQLHEQGILVIGVTRDRFESFARKAIRETGVTYANFLDFDEAYTSKQLNGVIPTWAVPSSVLIVDGTVRKVHVGPFHGMADAEPVTDLLPK